MPYFSGDAIGICDVCGFRYRMSQLRKRWDGVMVCSEDFEERHPQDFVRAVKDNFAVKNARPEPADVFLSPGDVTADDL